MIVHTLYVYTDTMELRATASMASAVRLVLKRGDSVLLLNDKETYKDEWYWQPVAYKGITGWAAVRNLRGARSLDDIPPTLRFRPWDLHELTKPK